jgi:hypothetical protein
MSQILIQYKPKFNWERVQWKTHRQELKNNKNKNCRVKLKKKLIVKKLRWNNIDVNIIY